MLLIDYSSGYGKESIPCARSFKKLFEKFIIYFLLVFLFKFYLFLFPLLDVSYICLLLLLYFMLLLYFRSLLKYLNLRLSFAFLFILFGCFYLFDTQSLYLGLLFSFIVLSLNEDVLLELEWDFRSLNIMWFLLLNRYILNFFLEFYFRWYLIHRILLYCTSWSYTIRLFEL